MWCWRLRWILGVVGLAAVVGGASWLRQLPFSSEPILYSYLQVVGSLLCFTYAANALVRFRGTHDRLTLILAFGFVLSGAIETVATFNSTIFWPQRFRADASCRSPGWSAGRCWRWLLIAALVVERRVPTSREPGREDCHRASCCRCGGLPDQRCVSRFTYGTGDASCLL